MMLLFSFALYIVSSFSIHAHGFAHDGLDSWKNILERLNSLETNLKVQKQENLELRTTVNKLQSEVATLRAENKHMQDQMAKLQTSLEASVQNNLSGKHGNHAKTLKKLKMPDKIQVWRPKFASIPGTGGIRQLQRRESEISTAFFATLSNTLEHLGNYQNIVFDRVITNRGNAYNNHAGDFRAPVPGVYVFSVTLAAHNIHNAHYAIYKGTHVVGKIYNRGQLAPYTSSSMTVVLELAQGEDVSIKNVDVNETVHGLDYSSFSGFLLIQDYSASVVLG